MTFDFPVVTDSTGGLADGFHVQDTPWIVLTSTQGTVTWQHGGWASAAELQTQVRKALGQ